MRFLLYLEAEFCLFFNLFFSFSRYEKNESYKKTIREKVNEYLKRAGIIYFLLY